MGDFVIGQKAAIYWRTIYGGTYVPATVERDTKLYWIADGRKFRKTDGREPGHKDDWGRGTYLRPLNHPDVIEAERVAKIEGAYSAVFRAQDNLRRDKENPARITALKQALDEYTAVLDK